MVRVSYIHLTPEDVAGKEYPEEKLIHWEIRIYQEESYASVYWFKNGVPFDKEPINGVAIYGYEINKEMLEQFINYIHKEFGGNILRRAYRIFLDHSNVITNNKVIADLANRLSKEFKCTTKIFLEFDDIEEDLAKKMFKRPLINK